jgi:hypothetical protein
MTNARFNERRFDQPPPSGGAPAARVGRTAFASTGDLAGVDARRGTGEAGGVDARRSTGEAY